jgi:hypothetical protein
MHWPREARAHRRRIDHGLIRGSRDVPQLHRCRADSRVPAAVLEFLLRPGRRRTRGPHRRRASNAGARGILEFRRLRGVGRGRVREGRRRRVGESMTLGFRRLLGRRRVRRDQTQQPRRLRVGKIRWIRSIFNLPCILSRWAFLLLSLPLRTIRGLQGMILPGEMYHLGAVSPEMGVEGRLRFRDLIQVVRMLDLHHLKTIVCGFQPVSVLCQ